MTITLYDMQDSPHARKVRLLAAELDIPLQKFDIAPYRNIAAWRERLRAEPYWSTA